VAKNVSQAAIGLLEAFLTVNLENVARPRHIDFYNILDFAGTMRHHDHLIGESHGFDQIMSNKNDGLAFLLPDF
jgi:hypothetical protein